MVFIKVLEYLLTKHQKHQTVRNAVKHDVGGGACKIVPNNKIGFRYRNRFGRVEERTRVTTSTRAARKGTLYSHLTSVVSSACRWSRHILSKATAQ